MSLTALMCAAFLVALVVWFARKNPLQSQVADRPDIEYKSYSAEFDVVCSADELNDVVNRNAVKPGAPAHANHNTAERTERFEATREQAKGIALASIAVDMSDVSVLILLDQSGSMYDRMPFIAGQLAECLALFESAGAETSLTGFTTVGWHGGQSRKQWINAGKPAYPGRLCDLLYTRFSEFDQNTVASNLLPLLGRNVLFENVDGEALCWGHDQLVARSKSKRILVIISDGAPVDDSSLSANGPKFLWRNLLDSVAALEQDNRLQLGAIGIDHRVESIYANSISVCGQESLVDPLIEMVRNLSSIH